MTRLFDRRRTQPAAISEVLCIFMKLRYLNARAMQIYLLRVRFGIIFVPSKEVVIHIYG